jgi:ABC-type multidrug transport system fused ATPase/permease subunit
MSDVLPPGEPWQLLSDLHQRVKERAPAEAELLALLSARNKGAEKRFQQARQKLALRYEQRKAAIGAASTASRSAIEQQFQAEHADVQRQWNNASSEVGAAIDAAHDAAKESLQEARWHAGAMFEAKQSNLGLQLTEIHDQLDAKWRAFDALQQEAEQLLRQRWMWRLGRSKRNQATAAAAGDRVATQRAPVQSFEELVARVRGQIRVLAAQRLPQFFEGGKPLWVLLFVYLAMIIPAAKIVGWGDWHWALYAAAAALVFGIVVGTLPFLAARKQSAAGYLTLQQILADVEAAKKAAMDLAKVHCQRHVSAIAEQRNRETKKATEDYEQTIAQLNLRKQRDLKQAEEKYAPLLAGFAHHRQQQLEETQARDARRHGRIDSRYQAACSRLADKYARRKLQIQEQFQSRWDVMAGRWSDGLTCFQSGIEQLCRACGTLFPDWQTVDWSHWTPPARTPPAILFGNLDFRLGRIEGGIPQDERLAPPQTDFTVPALFPFGDRPLLLLKTNGDGRAAAIEAIQALMLRMLTAAPPGKVRFMIIDPVGLGENFSAFMHLADYNDQLVSSRIWTDASHIEQRLTELTGHMENVIQVYLRNEFASIEDYNREAGDLAEPYRILVVANFPAGFSEAAATRLLSVVASGARCGVYTLLSVDPRQRLPREFRLADLEREAIKLAWSDGRFVLEHPEWGAMPLETLSPPPPSHFTEIVRAVGEHSRDADRVEVPFSAIAPAENDWWTADSRGGIDVPLGRAGAMKFQHLQLGKGTSQHVLIAGKTGSGKSTLLHALITCLALRYSPDDVEMYLIDFKKGVEFKVYAQSELPHARVVAIESEREFGLSVLERLDAELKRRGDMFRAQGVQDLNAFCTLRPDAKLPRILLIIDEFQELFVEDDRIAQNATLLLDRLVRQGRAFGIHVLLGSQTLAGSYSLPRSTIGQMAVRIALQCSDADAHLILSEENTAARLLTRPGEAIYNDANGLFEGNHPFQVVWLPDHERESYLNRLREFARGRNYPLRPPVVFEGNVAADPRRNERLVQLLSAPAWPAPTQAAQAWLGAAVAIKEPTSITLARGSGAHLLVVGHQEESALGMLAAAVISLAAQHAPTACGSAAGAEFCILDGSRSDSPAVAFWPRLARALPHAVKVADVRTAAARIAEISAELAIREASGGDGQPPLYLVIYDLARFRELRRGDDDFSFARSDENQPASPASQFGRILREGPALGIHALIWCDSYNNVNRTFDRQGLRELELRVLFQMNATDSSNLIDSPAASQLGVHRALLYNEAEGRLEKFRPYGPPPDDWLAWLDRQLHARLSAGPEAG